MALNKKGYFYSLTALLLLVLVYLFFSASKVPDFSRQSQVDEQRIQEISRIINLIGIDSNVGLKIAGFRTVLDLQDIVTTEDHIRPSSFDDVVEGLLLDGVYNTGNAPFSGDNSMVDWESKAVSLLEGLGVTARFDDSEVSLYQSSPWTIVANYSSKLVVDDFYTKSSWNKSIVSVVEIPVTNFYDPLFLVGASDYKRKIIRIPSNIVPSELNTLITNEYYVASDYSPGFLQRFQDYQLINNADFVNVGIESLVDTSSIYTPLISGKPIIDSLYFSDTYTGTTCIIQGYLFDSVHAINVYGLSCP